MSFFVGFFVLGRPLKDPVVFEIAPIPNLQGNVSDRLSRGFKIEDDQTNKRVIIHGTISLLFSVQIDEHKRFRKYANFIYFGAVSGCVSILAFGTWHFIKQGSILMERAIAITAVAVTLVMLGVISYVRVNQIDKQLQSIQVLKRAVEMVAQIALFRKRVLKKGVTEYAEALKALDPDLKDLDVLYLVTDEKEELFKNYVKKKAQTGENKIDGLFANYQEEMSCLKDTPYMDSIKCLAEFLDELKTNPLDERKAKGFYERGKKETQIDIEIKNVIPASETSNRKSLSQDELYSKRFHSDLSTKLEKRPKEIFNQQMFAEVLKTITCRLLDEIGNQPSQSIDPRKSYSIELTRAVIEHYFRTECKSEKLERQYINWLKSKYSQIVKNCTVKNIKLTPLERPVSLRRSTNVPPLPEGPLPKKHE